MKRLLAFALLVLAATAFCLPVCAVTPVQYDRALAQVQAVLASQIESLHRGLPVPPPLTASVVAARVLTPISAVEQPGLPPQPVNDRFLIAALTAAGRERDNAKRIHQLQDISTQIAGLRAAVREIPSDRDRAPAGERAEQAARDVLASNLYSSDPLPPPSWFDRFADWLDGVLSRLFRPRHAPSASAPSINPMFVKGLLIALLAGAFAVLVAVLVQWLRRRLPRSQPLALDETEAALVEARDTDSLRALADQKAKQGDYRLAIRFMYLALLVALDTDGVLRFDRSKTNWEYLRLLRASGRADVYAAMTPLTRDFDRIWYGSATAHAADYEGAVTQFEALQDASKSPSGVRQAASA